VNGALGPSSGWAFLFGASARDPGFLAAKRRVGVVPQAPGMYEEMNVRQYLELVAALYDVKSFEAIAERLGLGELMDRPSAKLSGGQQRRLSLCAAMMSEPELLILDEPSAGLDPVAAREMIDLLKDVSRDRTTLLCTHDLDEAEELCDNVIILRRGKVLVHDSIATLRRRAATRLALRARQGPERLAAALRERGHEPTIDDATVEVPAADAESDAPRLLRELLGAGIDVYDCRVLAPSLEDLFLQAVRAPESARARAAAGAETSEEEVA
jgi:ABC-2 type transport system ATP-binding protein